MGMPGHAAAEPVAFLAPYQKGTPSLAGNPSLGERRTRTTLQARYAYRNRRYRLSLASYEGMIPGPTLRVRPGDVVRIRLINDLPPNPDAMPLAWLCRTFQYDEFTFPRISRQSGGNLRQHFSIDGAGQSYDIEIAIPSDHTKGTIGTIRITGSAGRPDDQWHGRRADH